MRNEFENIGTMTAVGFPTGQAVLDFYFQDTIITTVGGDMGVLVAFSVVYTFMYWLVLQFVR